MTLTVQSSLTLMSGICWTTVYILIIYRSFKDKIYGMPFWALAFNVSWEFIFSLLLVSNPLALQAIINNVWFAFDIIVMIAYILYGKKDWPITVSKKWFYPYLILVLAVSFLFVYLLSVELDHSRGMYAAFIQNLMMSVLFIRMLLRRGNKSGQSAGIAIFKLIGTLAPTIIYGQQSRFVLFLGIACFVFDLIYLIMLLNFEKTQPLKNNVAIAS